MTKREVVDSKIREIEKDFGNFLENKDKRLY